MANEILLQRATKQDYKRAIDDMLEMRADALRRIALATMDDFDEQDILDLSYNALDSYRRMRQLKTEMRTNFPITCTCPCENHQEA